MPHENFKLHLAGSIDTSFYRVDDKGIVVRALHHSRTVVTEKDGTQRITERIEEVSNDQEISKKVRELLENVLLLDKHCSKKVGNDLLVCYPLRGGNKLRGYFVFQRDREVTPVEDAIVHGVLEVFTNYYELLDTSQRDKLTGLLNRHSLESNLDRIWNLLSVRLKDSEEGNERREPSPQTYWLGILDIDHFKSVNDTLGHIIGDEVLIMVTRILQSSFRQSDLLYRFGGEEFIVIIAANDLESARRSFERARKKIEMFTFPQVNHLTISVGFSGADPSVLPQEVINRADSALYAAPHFSL